MEKRMILKRGYVIPVLGIIALVFALYSVLSRKPSEKQQPINQPPVATYAKSIAGMGVIEPASELISVGCDLPGIVRQVWVKVGQKVTAGTPLFELDKRDIQAQINVLKASLETARIQADDARIQFEMVEGLSDKRAVSKDEYNRRYFAATSNKARVEEMRQRLKEAQTTLEKMTIKAPISGEILSLNVRPGEYVTSTSPTEPAVRIGDTSVLHVRVEIDEQHATKVKASFPATAMPRGNSDQKISLIFVKFEPYMRAKQNLSTSGQRVDARVLQVVYAVKSSEVPLFVGQQMDVYIESGSSK